GSRPLLGAQRPRVPRDHRPSGSAARADARCRGRATPRNRADGGCAIPHPGAAPGSSRAKGPMDVADLLIQTKERGGSDLHLSTGSQPLMRLHGHLTPMDGAVLGRDTVHKMIYEILNDDQRRVFEESRDLDFAIEVGEVARFRVNVFNQRNGEAAVFRVIPTQIRSFQELGMPEVIQTLALRENGLVLVTGPTGSGKSTTLAAMIDL